MRNFTSNEPEVLWKGSTGCFQKSIELLRTKNSIVQQYKKETLFTATVCPKCSPALYELRDFHPEAQTAVNREMLKSHLFRNHMRKVSGGDSSMSEFSDRSLWEGGWKATVGWMEQALLTLTDNHNPILC